MKLGTLNQTYVQFRVDLTTTGMGFFLQPSVRYRNHVHVLQKWLPFLGRQHHSNSEADGRIVRSLTPTMLSAARCNRLEILRDFCCTRQEKGSFAFGVGSCCTPACLQLAMLSDGVARSKVSSQYTKILKGIRVHLPFYV